MKNTTVPRTEEKCPVVFSVCPKRVFCFLMTVIVVLTITGTLARIVIYEVAPHLHHPLASLMKRLDLGHEPSLPNWYSSLALLASSLLLATIAFCRKQQRDPFARHWRWLSILFLLLAIDEAILIHEMANAPFQQVLQTSGVFYFGWIIPAFIFVLVAAGYFYGFVMALEKEPRRFFILGGATFLFGALGIEMLEGVIVTRSGLASIWLTAAQAVEEFCEMTGIAIFIYALLRYLQNHVLPRGLTLCPAPLRPPGTSADFDKLSQPSTDQRKIPL